MLGSMQAESGEDKSDPGGRTSRLSRKEVAKGLGRGEWQGLYPIVPL